jgi:hypothetical protein
MEVDHELCDSCLLADYSGPCVYRLLGVGGHILYIGHTGNLWARIRGHMKADYWPLVVSWDFTRHASIDEAKIAEAFEIHREQPPLNLDFTKRGRLRSKRHVLGRLVAADATSPANPRPSGPAGPSPEPSRPPTGPTPPTK